MKRLLLSLTAALALGAYAENTGDYGGTGFEALEEGTALDIKKDDAGKDGVGFWEGKEGEEYGVISSHVPENETIQGLEAGKRYLKVEADSTLYRYALDNYQEDRTIDVSKKAGIYFDSLVQFTGSEEIMVNNVDDRAKLAVWLYQCDTEDGVFGIGTNLVVTAGYLDAENGVTVSNYVTNLELAEGWHRLTVKMIPEIGIDTGVAGFVVFVDGVAVQNAEVKGDVGSVMNALNATAAKWAEKNALFPTMITKGDDKQTFECVGFKGQGALDELLVTENAPEFAADSTFFTLNWDAGLASLTIGGDPVAGFVEGDAGYTNITVETLPAEYEVVAVAQDGYNLGTRTVSGGVVSAGDDFTVNGTGIGNIVVNQAKFIVNGQPYSTLTNAIEAAGQGGTVKLNVDIEQDSEIESDVIALDGDDFVFDLAGHTITFLSDGEFSPISVDDRSTLKIIDSVGGGKLVGGDGGSIYSLGKLTIGDANGDKDKGATFVGMVVNGGDCLIVRGNFDKAGNQYADLDDLTDDGTTITDGDDYWVAAPGVEPPPSEDDCLITFMDENEGSEFVNFTYKAYTNDTVELTKTDNKVTVKQGATVKVVQTPNDGYEYVLDPGVVTETYFVDGDGNLVMIEKIGDKDELDWTLTEPTAVPPEPTTYAVSFYTNSVDAANLVAVTNIAKDAELKADEIPAIFGELEGAWDSDPIGAVITEATNFVFTIKAPEPTMWTVTFSTNTTAVAEKETSVADGGSLETEQIPAFEGGAWDVDPVTAVITCNTNFNYTIAAGKTYPTYIMDHASDELKAKFDEWATNVAKDRDTESANLDAFLLNCTPADVVTEKAKFKITSIAKVGDEWVVKACDKVDGEEYLNGYVNIVPYDINGEAADPANAEFFQATLTIQPVNTTEE